LILRFRHKGLERLFRTGDRSGVNTQHVARLRAILAALHTSNGPENLFPPGSRLHPLKGERRGQWAMWVSRNWRVIFRFEDGHATDVDDLVDYH
jgi:toxin HigB-1